MSNYIPVLYVDVITYKFLKLYADLAHLCCKIPHQLHNKWHLFRGPFSHFKEIEIKAHTFPFIKMYLTISSATGGRFSHTPPNWISYRYWVVVAYKQSWYFSRQNHRVVTESISKFLNMLPGIAWSIFLLWCFSITHSIVVILEIPVLVSSRQFTSFCHFSSVVGYTASANRCFYWLSVSPIYMMRAALWYQVNQYTCTLYFLWGIKLVDG